ncbi:MAG TPA: PQQ-binding-like beta-propeller repeat protein, partial [Candidatus Acidoferrum sp.]|nr:PQQ-binding-like beta-propeller repeat protein [Candidatus Acidoferrum sp.]
RYMSLPMTALITVLLLVSAASAQDRSDESRSRQWRVMGQNLDNSRSQPAERSINPANVNRLNPKWVFTTSNDVSATPTVDGDAVYFSDWGGNLYAVKKDSGRLIWSHPISDYNGITGSISRVSPAVDHDQLIIGDIFSPILNAVAHNGTNLIAVDRETGTRRWITQVDHHPAAIITGSPVVFEGVIYVGVSSEEESLAADPTYPCCTFRGSVVALDAKSGKMHWKTFTVPENGGQQGGYSGAAVWEPPAIDPKRGSLYVGTGDNYTVPAAVAACQDSTPKAHCAGADDHFDTALALDLKSGRIKWAKGVQDFDTITDACASLPNPICQVPRSPDFDFGGSGPNLIGDVVGFGQKSGRYWAFNPDNGNPLWVTQVGPGAPLAPIPGSTLGGIEWGTATDGKHIYIAIANGDHRPYTLMPSGQKITWGAWSALDVATGKIIWQTADPTVGAIDTGSVSIANGVMYAGSYSGQMYALDTITGKILWNFASGGSVIDRPSIVDGAVYWGSGYRNIPPGTGNNKVYAFSLSGSKDGGDNSKRGQK